MGFHIKGDEIVLETIEKIETRRLSLQENMVQNEKNDSREEKDIPSLERGDETIRENR
jgi:hypothetical protein